MTPLELLRWEQHNDAIYRSDADLARFLANVSVDIARRMTAEEQRMVRRAAAREHKEATLHPIEAAARRRAS